MPKVRFIKPWGYHAAGDVVEPPVNVADELIRSGRAVAVPEPTGEADGGDKSQKPEPNAKAQRNPKGK